MGLEINGLDTLQTKLDYIVINHTKNIKGKSLLIIVSYVSNTTESLKNYRMMQELKVAFYLLPIIIKYTGSEISA